jgi:hypothetical protein
MLDSSSTIRFGTHCWDQKISALNGRLTSTYTCILQVLRVNIHIFSQTQKLAENTFDSASALFLNNPTSSSSFFRAKSRFDEWSAGCSIHLILSASLPISGPIFFSQRVDCFRCSRTTAGPCSGVKRLIRRPMPVPSSRWDPCRPSSCPHGQALFFSPARRTCKTSKFSNLEKNWAYLDYKGSRGVTRFNSVDSEGCITYDILCGPFDQDSELNKTWNGIADHFEPRSEVIVNECLACPKRQLTDQYPSSGDRKE